MARTRMKGLTKGMTHGSGMRRGRKGIAKKFPRVKNRGGGR